MSLFSFLSPTKRNAFAAEHHHILDDDDAFRDEPVFELVHESDTSGVAGGALTPSCPQPVTSAPSWQQLHASSCRKRHSIVASPLQVMEDFQGNAVEIPPTSTVWQPGTNNEVLMDCLTGHIPSTEKTSGPSSFWSSEVFGSWRNQKEEKPSPADFADSENLVLEHEMDDAKQRLARSPIKEKDLIVNLELARVALKTLVKCIEAEISTNDGQIIVLSQHDGLARLCKGASEQEGDNEDFLWLASLPASQTLLLLKTLARSPSRQVRFIKSDNTGEELIALCPNDTLDETSLSASLSLFRLQRAQQSIHDCVAVATEKAARYGQRAIVHRHRSATKAALNALKIRKLYQQHIDQYHATLLNLEQAELLLTGAVQQKSLVEALEASSKALQSMNHIVDTDAVDELAAEQVESYQDAQDIHAALTATTEEWSEEELMEQLYALSIDKTTVEKRVEIQRGEQRKDTDAETTGNSETTDASTHKVLTTSIDQADADFPIEKFPPIVPVNHTPGSDRIQEAA